MKAFHKALVQKLGVLLVLVGIFIAAQYIFAWTNPSQNPPNGGSSITTDATGKVGIKNTNPTANLHVVYQSGSPVVGGAPVL